MPKSPVEFALKGNRYINFIRLFETLSLLSIFALLSLGGARGEVVPLSNESRSILKRIVKTDAWYLEEYRTSIKPMQTHHPCVLIFSCLCIRSFLSLLRGREHFDDN